MKDSLFSLVAVEEGESVSSMGTLVSDACDFRGRGIGVETELGVSWRVGEAGGSAPIPFTAETEFVGVETGGGTRRDAAAGAETLTSFPILRTGVNSGDPGEDTGVGIPVRGGATLGEDAPVEIFSSMEGRWDGLWPVPLGGLGLRLMLLGVAMPDNMFPVGEPLIAGVMTLMSSSYELCLFEAEF